MYLWNSGTNVHCEVEGPSRVRHLRGKSPWRGRDERVVRVNGRGIILPDDESLIYPSLKANLWHFTTSQEKKNSLRLDLGKNIRSLRPSRLWLRVVLTSRVFASVCKTVSSPFSKPSANHTCSWYLIWAILIKEQEKVLSSGGFRSSLLSAIDRVGQASTLYWFSREWSLTQNASNKEQTSQQQY